MAWAEWNISIDMNTVSMRYNQINRVVEESPRRAHHNRIELARPGGPITGRRVQHVHACEPGAEVMCMSESLPTLSSKR